MRFLHKWKYFFVRELQLLFSDGSIPLVMVGGVCLYGLLYNYMYAPNVVREVPVAVVDASASETGRRWVTLLDATPQVRVVSSNPDELAAKEALRKGAVQGLVYLPPDFAERIGRGEQGVETLLGSTSSFLYYSALRTATGGALQALNGELRSESALFLTLEERSALSGKGTLPMSLRALYNVTEGYATYLIPAVLMIILFQTLLMVVAMACGKEHEEGRAADYLRGKERFADGVPVVLGKSTAYLFLYLLLSFFLLCGISLLFDLPHGASLAELGVLLVPYLLATSFLGLSLSPWCTDSEVPLLGITFFSVGLLFLSGISYPLELMPWPWRVLHYLLPATSGTLAYIQLAAMGAGVEEIRESLLCLWLQVAGYFLLSLAVFRWRAARLKVKKD